LHSSVSPPATRFARILGARPRGTTTTFGVWAPEQESLELVIEGDGAQARADIRPLERQDRGYWTGVFDDVPPGTLYRFRLNGDSGLTFPDPASRYQPLGVHGPSQVVDPSAFTWTDDAWQAPRMSDLVVYELHVGTFTDAGTFDGVIDRLPYLSRLGVTAIEPMPIGDFPGAHNWGYDGVAMFAPARCYGTPDSLRALVDAAHRHGLAVVLDVVYNHFGPDGAYAHAFSPYYFSDRHASPWGRGINFDGPHSAEVRRFFIENALQWVTDYHVDALRLDATHAIVDDSAQHFLAELTSTVRAEAGRDVLLIAEDHRNLARMLRPVAAGGWGLDGVWADDFHHQARVHTAGDRDGYYADFAGTTADIATTLRQGWFYTGQYAGHLGTARGTDPAGLDPSQFVICLQNHDQVGNRFDGARLHHQIALDTYRALSVLLLVAPQTPLLFMGQEWAATTPFQFFTDHHHELGRQVTEGRRAEFAGFSAFNDAGAVPDPQARDTFLRSRLRWDEMEAAPHAGVRRLYERLLQLRREHPALRAQGRDAFEVRALDDHTVLMRRGGVGGSLLAVVRLSGGPASVTIDGDERHALLSTEDARFVESPAPIQVSGDAVRFERPGALLLI
jgi:maltooligosyltrehalose trehalohydrolase